MVRAPVLLCGTGCVTHFNVRSVIQLSSCQANRCSCLQNILRSGKTVIGVERSVNPITQPISSSQPPAPACHLLSASAKRSLG